MTIGIKVESEYNRQYRWHEGKSSKVAGCPSFKEHKSSEPPFQAKQRPTLELATKEEVPEVVKTFGSPSKDLHLLREPSFTQKKRVPGASPERISVNKALLKKAGLESSNAVSARYQSEYKLKFSPKKGATVPIPNSPIQSAKSIFIQSKTNLPVGKKPDKKLVSEYNARYADPTAELKHMRELYREQIRRKQLDLEKQNTAAVEEKPTVEETAPAPAPAPAAAPAPAPAKKLQLKIATPLKGDKPKVQARYDLISPQKSLFKNTWKSEYNSKFQSPPQAVASTAYGRRSHPYKATSSPEKVADLIKPDPSSQSISKAESSNNVDWFCNVVELRALANQFKAKSHGSHFSPNNLVQLAYSSAQLRDHVAPVQAVSEESVHIIPREKAPPVTTTAAVPENDLVVTDLEAEECPKIDNLIRKSSLTPARSKSASPPAPAKAVGAEAEKPAVEKTEEVAEVATESKPGETEAVAEEVKPVEKAESVCSVASRTADRSYSLFGDRVPTPRRKNLGSRHHFDRTTKTSKESVVEAQSALMAGRVATPNMEEGGSRHHLDHTTPAKPLVSGTQPFTPVLSEKAKLDFTSPVAPKAAWAKDLDYTVLSRASSCTSLASATLDKAKQRTDIWK